jgi:beta-phosphoglucomutase-like phosphatase (HAD superfamily)
MSQGSAPPLDLIIFDMDGVLVDSTPCHRLAFERLWQLCGIRGPAYEAIAGRRTREVVEEVTAALKPSRRQVDEWVSFKQACAREVLATRTLTYDDAIPALRAIARCGIPLALGTAASRASVHLVLGKPGWDSLFSDVVTGEDVTAGKPNPEIYETIMSRAAASPDRCVIVEDSAAGIEAAIAAGARVACVRSGLEVDDPAFLGSFEDLRELMLFLGVETS